MSAELLVWDGVYCCQEARDDEGYCCNWNKGEHPAEPMQGIPWDVRRAYEAAGEPIYFMTQCCGETIFGTANDVAKLFGDLSKAKKASAW